jgi:hypothetical protein
MNTSTGTAPPTRARSDPKVAILSRVISPKNTRWYIHSMYTAAKMMPVVASARPRCDPLEGPHQDEELPHEPVEAGQPDGGEGTTRKMTLKAGITFHRPP